MVATRPVLPSQIGCQTLERGLSRVSIVAAVHHTIRRTRSKNSSPNASNEEIGTA